MLFLKHLKEIKDATFARVLEEFFFLLSRTVLYLNTQLLNSEVGTLSLQWSPSFRGRGGGLEKGYSREAPKLGQKGRKREWWQEESTYCQNLSISGHVSRL